MVQVEIEETVTKEMIEKMVKVMQEHKVEPKNGMYITNNIPFDRVPLALWAGAVMVDGVICWGLKSE